jgi:6-phosphogluconate dehydrogenase
MQASAAAHAARDVRQAVPSQIRDTWPSRLRDHRSAVPDPATSAAPRHKGDTMQIGLIGLGRMGANMSRRWIGAGHTVVGYARHAETVNDLLSGKAISAGATSLADLIGQLARPRIVWLMVPAASVDATLDEVVPLLASDDVVVDGGNSYYVDDLRRAAELAGKGIRYLDCGTSGGVFGLERGYCLMIGGDEAAVKRLDPIFRALAPGVDAAPRTPGRSGPPSAAENGYLHCGPSGAGHFVKMVHNGIEYGIMAAYAEGLNILHHADAGLRKRDVSAEITPLRDPELYKYQLDLTEVSEVWRRGSVVASWLLDLTAEAFLRSGDLSGFAGRVSDSGEGRWTSIAAIDVDAPAPILTTALYERFMSRGEADFGDRVLSAMRFGFGGHEEGKK